MPATDLPSGRAGHCRESLRSISFGRHRLLGPFGRSLAGSFVEIALDVCNGLRLEQHLESAADGGNLSIRRGDVRSAREVDGRVRLLLENGGCLSAERVVLTTGFAPVFEHPFVDRVTDALGLERDYRGMPLLDDDTLAWPYSSDTPSRLFVSGVLVAGTVGPFAGTIVGARRAADRITAGIDDRCVAMLARP